MTKESQIQRAIEQFLGKNTNIKLEKFNREGENSSLINSISTDSRSLNKDSLYIALIGEKFDGHDFIVDAIKSGVMLCFSQYQTNSLKNTELLTEDEKKRIIKVENCLLAYQEVASNYRKLIDPLTIAITGSSGKTTTKELLVAALRDHKKLHYTHANFNNQIGVPKTILSMPEGAEILILEMGMRAIGEIKELSEIAEPNFAIITNIGSAHIERLGSRENIRQAKLEIISGLKKHDDYSLSPKLFVDEFLYAELEENPNLISNFALRDILSFSLADFSQPSMKVLLSKGLKMDIAVVEKLCAFLKFDLALVNKGLASYLPGAGRGEMIEIMHNGFRHVFIDETYNANPESVKNSLEAMLDNFSTKKKIAVIGDIAESKKELVDDLFSSMQNMLELSLIDARGINDFSLLQAKLNAELDSESVVLLKASRSAGLEKLLVRHCEKP